MAKQKIVIHVLMTDAKKRARALQTVVGFFGVVSAEIDKDKDEITIVGEGVDAVSLTKCLRKKMCCHADIVTVGAAEEEEEKKKEEKKKDEPKPCMPVMYHPPWNGSDAVPRYEWSDVDSYQNRDSCTLMQI